MNAVSYYQRKKALIKAKQRQTKLTTVDGVVLHGLRKRPHSEWCELCMKTKSKKGNQVKLDYHHWIPDHPAIGLWLCNRCHIVAEFLDLPTLTLSVERYHMLKAYAKEQYHQG